MSIKALLKKISLIFFFIVMVFFFYFLSVKIIFLLKDGSVSTLYKSVSRLDIQRLLVLFLCLERYDFHSTKKT